MSLMNQTQFGVGDQYSTNGGGAPALQPQQQAQQAQGGGQYGQYQRDATIGKGVKWAYNKMGSSGAESGAEAGSSYSAGGGAA
jgi:hypothetical protein